MSDHTQKSDNHTAGETPEFFTASDFASGEHSLVGLSESAQIVAAAIANRILSERGVRVYGDYPGKEIALWSPIPDKRNTHRALLIAVEPIVRDTPESLLPVLIDHLETFLNVSLKTNFSGIREDVERARRLLEGGAK